MNLGRINYDYFYLIIPSNNIKLYWLLGYIEGQGIFGFKNLVSYYKLGHFVKNLFVFNNNIINFIKN